MLLAEITVREMLRISRTMEQAVRIVRVRPQGSQIGWQEQAVRVRDLGQPEVVLL